MIHDLAAGLIDNNTIHEKNFKLGKLELLNDLTRAEFFRDLIDTLNAGGEHESTDITSRK